MNLRGSSSIFFIIHDTTQLQQPGNMRMCLSQYTASGPVVGARAAFGYGPGLKRSETFSIDPSLFLVSICAHKRGVGNRVFLSTVESRRFFGGRLLYLHRLYVEERRRLEQLSVPRRHPVVRPASRRVCKRRRA